MYISWVKPKFWFEFCQLFVKQSSIYMYIYVCVCLCLVRIANGGGAGGALNSGLKDL